MKDLGLIHIYCGDGKGKTTAATGLAVRSSGDGKRVLFVQFFKDGTSSEIKNIQKLENIETLHCNTVSGFFFRMSKEEQAIARQDYTSLFETAIAGAKDFDLLVLDEIISTCNLGVIDLEKLLSFLDHKPEALEVVLTGRNPAQALIERADYVTEMKKIKHPYDQGIVARKGIEY